MLQRLLARRRDQPCRIVRGALEHRVQRVAGTGEDAVEAARAKFDEAIEFPGTRQWIWPEARLLHAYALSPGPFVGLAFLFLGRFVVFRLALDILVQRLVRRPGLFFGSRVIGGGQQPGELLGLA